MELRFSSIKMDSAAETKRCEASVARAKKKIRPFNVQSFLSTVDDGGTVRSYRKNDKIFSHGDRADAVFYIQEGRVKVCVIATR
jgi:CRP-like cAMP-binding protein